MEFARPIIKVVGLLCPFIAREVEYIWNLDDNMKKLDGKMGELACVENDVREEVTNAKSMGKKSKEEVNYWLKNVKAMKDEVNDIKKKVEVEENRRCLMGCSSNYCSLRKIAIRTLEMIEEVKDLLNKRSFEGGMLVSPPLAKVQVMCTTSLVGSTAEQNFNLIWNLLMEENSGIIGIYGMGGVGKTTIMKKINNQLESTKKFDIVIWVTVSKDFNLKRLQSAIADRLNFHEDLDEERLSIQLLKALRGKKFLLVLDDVWDRISLEQIGIPKPSVGNGCKVVLTTRSHRVCQSMETDKVIKIKELSEEEAWLLFKEKVGATALVGFDVEVVAKQVANECKGLPLAIITVGRALRGVIDVGQWRHALKQLRNAKPEVGDMEDEVFVSLRFSYQKLKREKLRTCFLYCSLFPEDYEIPEDILVELWICEGFIEEDGDKQAMVDEGRSILNELVEACMLERSRRYAVKMHDLMRDMAIGITRKSPIFIVKAGIRLEKVVADKEWAEDVERVSLMRNKIKMLSGEPPKCPKLLTLFLNENPISHFESHSFFQHVNQLRVLDLSETEIEELPESVSSLENLHMLYLDGCRMLKRVPSLAKLKNLRCLDLSHTCIEELPEGMEELVELRLLNLYKTERLRWFPIEMLPRLSLLEVFKMKGSSFLWSSSSSNEGERMEGRSWFEEVTRLTRLVYVSFDLAYNSSFRKYSASMLGWISKIKTFHFGVAKSIAHKSNGDFILTLRRKDQDELQMSIRECEEEDTKTWIPQFLLDFGIVELAELMSNIVIGMRDCKGMEWLSEARDYDHLLLSKLKSLHLANMPDLRALQKGTLLHGTLANLQNLHIRYCPKLKNLFSLGTLQSLQNLKNVDISACIAMEEVVAGEEDEKSGFNTVVTLPNLESIALWNLPALQSICCGTMVCSSLTTIHISSCCKLKKIPLIIDKPRPDDLKAYLRGTREWWDALDWVDLVHTKDLLKSSFEANEINKESSSSSSSEVKSKEEELKGQKKDIKNGVEMEMETKGQKRKGVIEGLEK